MKLHICNGCGEEKILDERVRHWHDCHPAKFSYMVKADKLAIAQMVGAFQQSIQLTAATPRKTGAKSQSKVARKSRRG
jgi:hypothetical protein